MSFAQSQQEVLQDLSPAERVALKAHEQTLHDIYGVLGTQWSRHRFVLALRTAAAREQHSEAPAACRDQVHSCHLAS
ncbi:MAG: hypothetical protein WKF57_03825 [Nakamurella sp.]